MQRSYLNNVVPSLQDLTIPAVGSLGAEIVLRNFLANPGSSMASVGRVAIIFIALYTLHRFALTSFRSYKPKFRDIVTISLILLFSIVLLGGGRLVCLSLIKYLDNLNYFKGVGTDSLEFAIPYSVGGLVIQAVLGLHYGIVFGVSYALITGIYTVGQPLLATYVLVSVLVACLSLSRFRSRSAYTKAGFNVVIVSLPFVLGSILSDGNVSTADIIVRLGAVLLNGALCTSIAAGITPTLEYLGGYVTDLRLIEMATLDHPLLKELSIQAAGTWNHSMVMGMMVESAANAIGANSVIARVGAYFHDIGKIKKPLYFVENQGDENRHDKLSPSMSALIIRSHVKDGMEMARKHKLPIVIEDMIPQHHGTSMIEYFYDKALKEAGEDSEVDKSLYSYPGPRPQTKEAGILMLADSIEAATRTISDPTQDRIQGLVQKLINKIFASGELDECELTLKDLHAIAKAFTHVLTGIYHQRVAYAEPAEKISERTSQKIELKEEMGGAGAPRKERSAEDKPAKEPGKEDLKRLGLQ